MCLILCTNLLTKTDFPLPVLKTNNPYTFYVPDGYDPDHFMPWVHPFTSVISGPTGSGKSVFVRRFVHNIKHMMTPILLWCFPRWNRFWTMYITLMFLWWLFFVNREATLWSVSSMRSSRMIKRSWPWRIKCIPKGRNTFWKPTQQPLLDPTAI
jgi:hypothetical protein